MKPRRVLCGPTCYGYVPFWHTSTSSRSRDGNDKPQAHESTTPRVRSAAATAGGSMNSRGCTRRVEKSSGIPEQSPRSAALKPRFWWASSSTPPGRRCALTNRQNKCVSRLRVRAKQMIARAARMADHGARGRSNMQRITVLDAEASEPVQPYGSMKFHKMWGMSGNQE